MTKSKREIVDHRPISIAETATIRILQADTEANEQALKLANKLYRDCDFEIRQRWNKFWDAQAVKFGYASHEVAGGEGFGFSFRWLDGMPRAELNKHKEKE